MLVDIQTDGLVSLGWLPNENRYPCLVCGTVPDVVMVDLFVPESEDINFPVPEGKTLVLPYRLCEQCHHAKPDAWKIRLLILGRLHAVRIRGVK